ncbi:MAG: ATP-binding protein [Magnetococcales bacterium]|nr:ATP-binding protein [Magnetococcales bacterium]
MVATLERQYRKRLPTVRNMKLLPITAIYGGNASGKSNLVHALSFIKNLVVKGTSPKKSIPVVPFRLDRESIEKPSKFQIAFVAGKSVYEYSFAVTRQHVVEEKLVEVLTKGDKILYDRQEGKYSFDPTLPDHESLKIIGNGTRDNQLYLSNSVSQNQKQFLPVYEWFEGSLLVIGPEQSFLSMDQMIEGFDDLPEFAKEMLQRLDTGISRLESETIPYDNAPIPKYIKEKVFSELADGDTENIGGPSVGHRYILRRKEGENIIEKVVSYHGSPDGIEVKFDLMHESDGTLRLIDLLPAFSLLINNKINKVVIIDELDRSLHTLLTRSLLEEYLQHCSPESGNQLIFTTHDVMLMDQSMLRRDEMWVTERDDTGNTTLFSFSDYKDVRYDKDVRKSYLLGRMGGVPRILFIKMRNS